MISKPYKELVHRIIAKHGAAIDLEKKPETLLEILRELGLRPIADDGYPPDNPCAGAPPQPAPPPPGPSSAPLVQPTNTDILHAVHDLTREVRALQKSLEHTRPT